MRRPSTHAPSPHQACAVQTQLKLLPGPVLQLLGVRSSHHVEAPTGLGGGRSFVALGINLSCRIHKFYSPFLPPPCSSPPPPPALHPDSPAAPPPPCL